MFPFCHSRVIPSSRLLSAFPWGWSPFSSKPDGFCLFCHFAIILSFHSFPFIFCLSFIPFILKYYFKIVCVCFNLIINLKQKEMLQQLVSSTHMQTKARGGSGHNPDHNHKFHRVHHVLSPWASARKPPLHAFFADSLWSYRWMALPRWLTHAP